MQVALGRSEEEEYRDNLYKLGELLGGNCSLFFTNRPKEEILNFFKEYKSVDYARAGFKATETFVIPEGEMPFAHSLFEEFKKFVESNSMYMYWSRCEYEVILLDWPNQKTHKKIDIHWQIMNNIDLVTNILMENVL